MTLKNRIAHRTPFKVCYTGKSSYGYDDIDKRRLASVRANMGDGGKRRQKASRSNERT